MTLKVLHKSNRVEVNLKKGRKKKIRSRTWGKLLKNNKTEKYFSPIDSAINGNPR